jgi:hypothetical protein
MIPTPHLTDPPADQPNCFTHNNRKQHDVPPVGRSLVFEQ